jgi:hypothetical protein
VCALCVLCARKFVRCAEAHLERWSAAVAAAAAAAAVSAAATCWQCSDSGVHRQSDRSRHPPACCLVSSNFCISLVTNARYYSLLLVPHAALCFGSVSADAAV